MSETPRLMELEEALALLAAAVPTPRAEAIWADRDDPALDRSAMDGIVLRAAEGLAARKILGTIFAGDDPAAFCVESGGCLRIMTGACIPEGGDAVVPVELLQEREGWLAPIHAPNTGDHIRRRGDQAFLGSLLLSAGQPLNAARRGLRAQVGMPPLPLLRVRIGIASTGDELRGDPAPWQIRDSNGPMLAALAHTLGAEAFELPPVPDDPAAVADLGELDVAAPRGRNREHVVEDYRDTWDHHLGYLPAAATRLGLSEYALEQALRRSGIAVSRNREAS